uniref:Sporulation protein YqfC n=1 Tax=uncultured Bacillota bacterium TaxID=344338 RepID=A0A650EPT9_9FIRM|nr:hypothetical protein Firmicute1046_3540 [uncultured Firmicutes bacterium]
MFRQTKKQQSDIPTPSLREKMANALDMSKEVLLDTVRVVAIGNRELTLENYRNIMEYTTNCIRVSTNPHIIKIIGKNLEIKTITQEMLYITGYIKSFEYQQN